MEVWDIYDQDRVRTGELIERGSKLAPAQYHLVVHVCIFNKEGELLIQQRQPFKKGWPGKWDLSVGGSALAGESSQVAAQRETWEELGLKFDFSQERPFFTINFSRGFDDFYLIEAEVKTDDLVLQASEVKDTCWVDHAQLIDLRERGKLIPYHRGLLDMIFEMRVGRGTHPPRKLINLPNNV
ncbi:MAG TPA: NUDIX domain-containing protein [Saprospiraceae bacterium]|nr:NUDIX domain-containing protein [Saprospiraceae bacterium]